MCIMIGIVRARHRIDIKKSKAQVPKPQAGEILLQAIFTNMNPPKMIEPIVGPSIWVRLAIRMRGFTKNTASDSRSRPP